MAASQTCLEFPRRCGWHGFGLNALFLLVWSFNFSVYAIRRHGCERFLSFQFVTDSRLKVSSTGFSLPIFTFPPAVIVPNLISVVYYIYICSSPFMDSLSQLPVWSLSVPFAQCFWTLLEFWILTFAFAPLDSVSVFELNPGFNCRLLWTSPSPNKWIIKPSLLCLPCLQLSQKTPVPLCFWHTREQEGTRSVRH